MAPIRAMRLSGAIFAKIYENKRKTEIVDVAAFANPRRDYREGLDYSGEKVLKKKSCSFRGLDGDKG
ncbi:MAG: hypothetical protein ACP5SH_00635 [Syntrophobacteraceae bacterium]